jgi:hypothetical protein
MLTTKAIRQVFGGRLEEARRQNRSYGQGCMAALREWNDMLGLESHPRSAYPALPLDDRGLPYFKHQARVRPSEISLRSLAEAIHGHEFVEEWYHPAGGFTFGNLMEAAIDPTAFSNINLFNLATAGLINAEIMERFNQPEYIGRNLVTIKPTKMNGQKLVAVARQSTVGTDAKRRLPGRPHAEVGFSEAYQTTPETVEQALKARVTREAVFFDYTEQVLEEADEIGNNLAYTQEQGIADMILGVTGLASEYNRNGTSYETYQTSSPWVNDQSNPATAGSFDYSNIDKSRQLFIGQTDPESGREIKVMGNTILCMPYTELLFRQQVYGSNLQLGSQQTSGNFPGAWTQGPNPLTQATSPWAGAYTIINVGPIWYNRATAADGLNLSASNAQKYWYHGDFPKAFWWMENWPLTPWMASADEYRMRDEGLVAVYGANYRGTPYVREPRYVVRNKN